MNCFSQNNFLTWNKCHPKKILVFPDNDNADEGIDGNERNIFEILSLFS